MVKSAFRFGYNEELVEKKPEKLHEDRWLRDDVYRSEIPEFTAEEMIECAACKRKSPPNRLKCLYCGAEFVDVEPMRVQLPIKKLESHEFGFNVVIKPFENDISRETSIQLGRLVKLSSETIVSIFQTQKYLPLARVESEKDAEAICVLLGESGIDSIVVSDRTLLIEQPARRLRSISFADDAITFVLFSSNEKLQVLPDDISNMVFGRIIERRISSKSSIRTSMSERLTDSGKKKPDTSEISGDEPVIDIYLFGNGIPFRISTHGFDFSSLGAKKKLIANENLSAMFDHLQSVLPNAIADTNYEKMRALVGCVWEVEEKTDSGGVHRQPMGKFERTSESVISNERQFERYSRLQFQLSQMSDPNK